MDNLGSGNVQAVQKSPRRDCRRTFQRHEAWQVRFRSIGRGRERAIPSQRDGTWAVSWG